MSATKGFASMCVQILADRGQIDVDERVATYWPEYAQNGKEATTVRQLLLHTGGVVGFDQMHEVVRHDGTGWGDLDVIAPRLAESAPSFAPGTEHTYHALTIGWLVGEIVRRVDGRSLGRFFAEEIAGPLGLDAWIGLPDDEVRRVAHVYGIRLAHLPKPLRGAQEAMLAAARDPDTLLGRAFVGNGTVSPLDFIDRLFNDPRFLAAEVPAGNGVATARAVARCWAMMANGGELDGTRVLSADAVEQWSRVISNQADIAFKQFTANRLLTRLGDTPLPRTLGYLGNGGIPGLGHRFGPNPSSFGAEGLGGQYGFCDPDANIAVGYVRSELAAFDVLQATLTRELYRCAVANGHVVTGPKRSLGKRATDTAFAALARRWIAVPTTRLAPGVARPPDRRAAASSDPPEVIRLWPDGPPFRIECAGDEVAYRMRYGLAVDTTFLRNISDPTLTVFAPNADRANGVGVVVAPGGGWTINAWTHEGLDVARWLADAGCTAFLLKYRVQASEHDQAEFEARMAAVDAALAARRPTAQLPRAIADLISTEDYLQARAAAADDGRRAIEIVRENASAIRGSSGRRRHDRVLGRRVPRCRCGARPTRRTAGLHRCDLRRRDRDAPVPADAPPLFTVVAHDDVLCKIVEGLHADWSNADRSSELHVFARGAHGFGMVRQGAPSDRWTDLFLAWLHDCVIRRPA